MEKLQYYSGAHYRQGFVVIAALPLGISIIALSSTIILSYYSLSGLPAGTAVRPLDLCGDVFAVTAAAAVGSFIIGVVAVWTNRRRFWPCALAIMGILVSLSSVPLSLLAIRYIIAMRGLIDLG